MVPRLDNLKMMQSPAKVPDYDETVNSNLPPRKSPLPTPPAAKPTEGFTTHIPCLPNTFLTPDQPEPPHRGPTGTAKTIFIVLLVLAAIGIYRKWGPSSAMAGWQPNWEKGVDESQAKKKPILVLFSADWCAACNHFQDNVLSRREVTDKLDRKSTRLNSS